MSAVVAPAVAVNAAQAVTVAVAPAVRMVSSSNSGDEQVLSSNSSPAATAAAMLRTTTCTTTQELIEENERLRKENAQLNQELNRLRSLCNNVYNLMSNYSVNPADIPARIPEGRALELLDSGGAAFTAAEEDISPRLFGVSIGVKRVKRSNEEESDTVEDQDQVQPHGSDMESEPLDSGSAHHDDQPWIYRLDLG